MKTTMPLIITVLSLALLLWACSPESPEPTEEQPVAVVTESAAEQVQSEPEIEPFVEAPTEPVEPVVQAPPAQRPGPIMAPPSPVRSWHRLAEVDEFITFALARLESGEMEAVAEIMREVVMYVPRVTEGYPDGPDNVPENVQALFVQLNQLTTEITESNFSEDVLRTNVPQIMPLVQELYTASGAEPGI